MKKTLLAYAMFAGGVIGVGVFGLPYVLIHAGVLPTAISAVLVLGIVWITHLLYADIVLRTSGKHRLPGYIRLYLGPLGFWATSLTNLFGFVGALLVYPLVGGVFTSLLLAPIIAIPPWLAAVIYFAIGAFILLRDVRQLPLIQLVILVLFCVTLAALSVRAATVFQWSIIPPSGEQVFLPYGVLLFAFWGLALVPELVEMTGRSWSKTRSVLLWSLSTAAVTYAAFAVVIAGITGPETSEDALSGVAAVFGNGVLLLGAFFGVLTTFSSFIALGLACIRTLTYDFRVRPLLAWAVAMGAPFALYLLGFHAFIRIMSVTGAVFLGVEALLVLLMFLASRPGKKSRMGLLGSRVVLVPVSLLLIAGVVFEVLRVLARTG